MCIKLAFQKNYCETSLFPQFVHEHTLAIPLVNIPFILFSEFLYLFS